MTKQKKQHVFACIEDVPDDLLNLTMTYMAHAGSCAKSRQGWRIPGIIVNDWLLNGYGVIETNTFAKHYGTSRRAVCRAIRNLVDAGAVQQIGRTQAGSPMLVPNLDIVADKHVRRVQERAFHSLERDNEAR